MAASEIHEPTRKQLRGSSLLLAGRLLSTGLQFVSQVLIVRYLTTTDFGAFAYALAAVSLFESISSLGLKHGIARFAPIYHEQRDFARLAGVMVLVLVVIASVSTAIIGALFAFPGLLARMVHGDAQPLALLGILIFLVPLEALDELLLSLFASFAKPRAIFWRKHVLGPGLKLVVVAMLVGLGTDAKFLASGYVLASLAGVLFYAVLFVRLLRRTGLWTAMRTSRVRISLREVFGFTIPLMTSDLLNTVMIASATFLLGYWRGTADVALFRVVFPAARLNTLVMSSFSILYTPAVARLFARGDLIGIETLYRRTAVWLAALSLPVLLITGGLARSLTVLLYGERYAAAWPILVLLSFGHFASIATGFNGLTLKVMGKLRSMIGINITACVVQLVLLAILIPRMGPLGAAIATCVAMIVHNVLKQVALHRVGRVHGFRISQVPFYATLLGAAGALFALQEATRASFWVLAPVALIVAFGVLWAVRWRLGVIDILPEMGRIPIFGRWLGARSAPGWRWRPRLDMELHFGIGVMLFVALVILNAPSLLAQRFGNEAAIAALTMGLIAVPAFGSMLSQRHLVIDWTLLLMLGFLATSLVSTVFARDAVVALDWTRTYVFEGVFIYLLVVNAVRDPHVLRRMLASVVAAAALLSALSIYQEASRDYHTQFGGLAQRNLERGVGSEMVEGSGRSRTKVLLAHRASGPIGDPNRYAQVLLVTAPLAYALMLVAKRRVARVAALTALACILGGIATTYSRSTFLVTIGLVVVTASTRFVRFRHLVMALVVLAVLVPVIAPGYAGRVRSVQGAFDVIRGRKVATADGATRGRLTEMLAAWNVFLDHPFVGVGPGHFEPYYSVEYMSDPQIAFRQIDRPRRAHNLFFELAAETGIAGVSAFAAIVLLLGVRLRTLRRRALAKRDHESAALAAALAFALLAYLGTAFFLHLAYQRYFWLLVGIAGATVQVLGERGVPVRILRTTWQRPKRWLEVEGA